MDPEDVMVPPVKGAVAVIEVTLPIPVLNGPTVVPLILAKIPAVVVHRSPLTGVVGAAPWGKLIPAAVVVDNTVTSFPVRVPPVRLSLLLNVVQFAELRNPGTDPVAF
jgi:hypothetical protein